MQALVSTRRVGHACAHATKQTPAGSKELDSVVLMHFFFSRRRLFFSERVYQVFGRNMQRFSI
jgi:hypothetical protein